MSGVPFWGRMGHKAHTFIVSFCRQVMCIGSVLAAFWSSGATSLSLDCNQLEQALRWLELQMIILGLLMKSSWIALPFGEGWKHMSCHRDLISSKIRKALCLGDRIVKNYHGTAWVAQWVEQRTFGLGSGLATHWALKSVGSLLQESVPLPLPQLMLTLSKKKKNYQMTHIFPCLHIFSVALFWGT